MRFDRALLCRGAIDYMNMLNGGAAQEVQLTAPAKKWQPPGGYDPKSRSASAGGWGLADDDILRYFISLTLFI